LSTPDRLVPDTHAYTHDGQRQVPRHRPDIRAQLTGSFTDVDQRFIKERRVVSLPRRSAISARRQIAVSTPRCMPIHCTRDASRDTKRECADHHPRRSRATPPSDSQPIGRVPKATPAATPTKPPAVVRYRRPADRRSRPQQWADAVQTLASLLGQFQEWRDNLSPSLDKTARRLGSPRSRRRAPGGQLPRASDGDCGAHR
jgi:hypothetical protein